MREDDGDGVDGGMQGDYSLLQCTTTMRTGSRKDGISQACEGHRNFDVHFFVSESIYVLEILFNSQPCHSYAGMATRPSGSSSYSVGDKPVKQKDGDAVIDACFRVVV